MSAAFKGSLDFLTRRPIAHRGLHDGNQTVWENTMSAFRAARDAGFGIECDVHLSADDVPVVFHDSTLDRVTNETGRLCDRTAGELAKIAVGGTADHIPSLTDLLDLVAGAVPLVIEMKSDSATNDAHFLATLLPLVAGYGGPLALMSFDEGLIAQALAAHPPCPIGLTAEGTAPAEFARHRRVFERGCSFVSYNVHHLPNPFISWVRDDEKLPVICWTVRTPQDVAVSNAHADQMTFEGLRPGP
ncbi:glycerophosphodiester phosphodiesterase family protein [Consotaella aegiceratis]|uniref:glycerophosphodiester phosphodiesterase family protein n=1 Tax=Consotaella aegiceratis TaxID=3097961 RepID=UPI002F4292C8